MMEKEVFMFTDDMTLERRECGVRGKYIQVLDGEFMPRLELPDSLSDGEAKQVVRLINQIYRKGFKWGQQQRGREIASLLGINTDASRK